MSRIRIKNFGPIKEGYLENDGWLDIKKVTVFIGNQGTGKSTVAKLISTFTWIEKVLVRGDFDRKWFERKNKLQNQYLDFHRLETYFKSNGQGETVIEYEGDAYALTFRNGALSIAESATKPYRLPQIMYVPAERNFISYVRSPKELKLSSGALLDFLAAFERAKAELKESLALPIDNVDLEFDRLNDTLNLKGSDFKVKLTDASSGFQSLVPLFLVSWHLANAVSTRQAEPMSQEERSRFAKEVKLVMENENLTEDQKRLALDGFSARFNKTAFINIVEEPEQNLFPSSQREMLYSLLEFNNMNLGSKLILTTHSPYMINFLNVAIQGQYLANAIEQSGKNILMERLNTLVPLHSLVAGEDVVVYEMENALGRIHPLPSPLGIPTDKNYLNNFLREGNRLFDALLELEEELAR